jgi:hypothetical protein
MKSLFIPDNLIHRFSSSALYAQAKELVEEYNEEHTPEEVYLLPFERIKDHVFQELANKAYRHMVLNYFEGESDQDSWPREAFRDEVVTYLLEKGAVQPLGTGDF